MSPLRVALAVIRREGRFFLQRRSLSAEVFPGLWEFPGGKVEPGEDLLQALLRELQEEIAWAPSRVEPLPPIRHSYSVRQVELNPFLCQGVPSIHTGLAWGWFRTGELRALPMPEANGALLSILDNLDMPL